MNAGSAPLRWRAAMVTGLALALGACTVGPNYVRPSAAVPPAYAEAHGAGAPGATIAAHWWQAYGDPGLDALLQQVGVGNQSLQAAAARVRVADALLRTAEGALVPSVSIGTVTRGISGRKDFGLSVAWEVDFWGRIRRNVEAHRADAEASQDDLAAATLSMQAQAAQGYFALQAQEALIELLQQDLDTNVDWLRMLRNRAALGLVPAATMARAESRLATARTRLADARLSRAQIEHALAVLAGKPPAGFQVSASPLPLTAAVPSIPAELPSQLLARRPDIAAAERRVAAASARIGVSEAERLPSLNLAGGVGILDGLFGAVDLQAPLYRGGALPAGVAEARAAYEEAVANYRQTVLGGFQEVEDNLAAQRILGQAASANHGVVRGALESERVARNQYEAGLGDYASVVGAVDAAVQARTDALDLQQRRLDASVALIKAMGGGWQGIQAANRASTAR